ncbi:type IX secretion system outer membrane channel protein PorV [Aureibacter tunicatorum]|uniref:Type IX secretion system protein PorV domain-containing protein n=1 Tax=Aureibacter tunicatorum TaxID=866807 RepID=A0AAE4BRB5_9BACT|nr:type IX secretion system outer membrane channel protein PorV [Aureibacter tunicatorum]MDR6237778.1 hypothetical protein [Aureibacter tunicatorum]BDD02813.1 hypothetical protein AUTU_02960 [Aureibacter tunicatorum]
MNKCRLLFLSLIASFALSNVNAQVNNPDDVGGTKDVIATGVPFLRITPDARGAAMGDVGIATTADANSVHYNAGKLAFIEDDMGASISYTPWLGKIVNDMWVGYLSGYYKINKEQTVNLFLRYFDLGSITFTDESGNYNGESRPREFAVGGTYSRMLSDKIGLGITARYIYSNVLDGVADAVPGNSVSADIGFYYNNDYMLKNGKKTNLALGAAITNIGGKINYGNEDNASFLPTNLGIGASYRYHMDPYNSIAIALDFNKLLVPRDSVDQNISVGAGMIESFGNGFGDLRTNIGVEYWYKDIFAGRTGYQYESADAGGRQYVTLGVGFRYQVFGLDMAYLIPTIDREHPLSETLRFSLLFNFGDRGRVESIKEN